MRIRFLPVALAGLATATLAAGQSAPQQAPPNPPAATPHSKATLDDPAKKVRSAETELQRAISGAGNDQAALVRNLEDYLAHFPDAPRKAAIYRALVEASEQLHDYTHALDYAERLIALEPNDSDMMLHAASLLQKRGDDHSLVKAVGYLSRVLSQVEKMSPTEKSARVSLAEWEIDQTKMRGALYLMRGKIELDQHNEAAAEKDLETSYQVQPSASAAEKLGEIAEARKDLASAAAEYTKAFVLPESAPGGSVDRADVRQKLGNVWRELHGGSELGLGDAVLAAYDRLKDSPKPNESAARNKEAKDPFAFVLRRLDGSSMPLAPLRGKVVILSFWATWCAPCRVLEPMLADIARNYADKPDVVFLAVNADEDESRVQPFVTKEKLALPVVFADGLDTFLGVRSLPTVVVLDRAGKIVSRVEGFSASDFSATMSSALEKAFQPPN
jgi:thiol-disulfide isomerase/thioredoxin